MQGPPGEDNRGSPWIFFFTCCLSHLAFFPGLREVAYQRHSFELSMGFLALLVSFMYHACESFSSHFFLTELQWHRLDNICAISSLAFLSVHLSCFESKEVRTYTIYFFFITAILFQEKDPWNLFYTVTPVVCSLVIPVVSHLRWPRRRHRLNRRSMVTGVALLLVALPFFVAGLDDKNDPYRMFHGTWHVFVGIAMYYMWHSMRQLNCPLPLESLRAEV